MNNYRNHLIHVNLQLAILTTGLGMGTFVAGLFGMNLRTCVRVCALPPSCGVRSVGSHVCRNLPLVGLSWDPHCSIGA